MVTVDAMSSHKLCMDCEHCSYTDKQGVKHPGRYKTFDRRASRRASVRRFGVSWQDAESVVNQHPDVLAFFEELGDMPEQLFPRPCCPSCETCASTIRDFVVGAGTRLNLAFVKMLRALGHDVGMITLTAPAIAPRPEHLELFYDVDARADFRYEWLVRRAHLRVETLLRGYVKYLRPVGFSSDNADIESLVKACAVLFEHGMPSEDLPSEELSLDNELSTWFGSGRFSSEEPAGEPAGEPDIVALRSRYLSIQAYKLLFDRSLEEVEEALSKFEVIGGLESPIEGAWQVRAWQFGWLQSVYGPGRDSPAGTPTFYIPRRGKKRFTYVGSEDGRAYVNRHWHRKFGDLVPDHIEPFRMSPSLFNHLFRGFKKRLKNWHPDMVPGLPYSESFQLGPDGKTNRRNFRKSLCKDKPLGIDFWYLGVDELGSVDVRDTERRPNHYHLHLLVNLPKGSVEKARRRAVFKELWHFQSGNVYWGLPRKVRKSQSACGIPRSVVKDPFCSPLQDDVKSARYVAKYQAKEGGRVRVSQNLNLRHYVQEESAISWNEELAIVAAARGNPFELVNGTPHCKERLSEEQLATSYTEWVGLSVEDRRIGSEPVHVASAITPPSPSIHRAGGVKVTFGSVARDVIPFAYWVPKHVWVSAQSNPSCKSALELKKAFNNWAESAGDILFPP